jgi:hypothetical protein
MSAHRKGKPLSKEHAQKIADYRKGKPLSDATKDKIRQRQLAVVRDVVLCSSGKVFRCASDAEKWLRNNGFPKASNTAIGACCRGMRRSAYGFKWAYANKVLDT